MITIVTSRGFLLCEAINHITLHAEPEQVGYTSRVIPYYKINICFVPGTRSNNNQNNNNRQEDGFVEIKVIGEKTALYLFKEIVSQMREQIPDQAYLNDMIEKILSGGKDVHDDSSMFKADKPRPKKGRSKAVLRGSSSGRKRGRK